MPVPGRDAPRCKWWVLRCFTSRAGARCSAHRKPSWQEGGRRWEEGGGGGVVDVCKRRHNSKPLPSPGSVARRFCPFSGDTPAQAGAMQSSRGGQCDGWTLAIEQDVPDMLWVKCLIFLLSLPDLGDRSNGHCPAMRRPGQKMLKPMDTRAPMSGNRDMGATDTVDTLMVDNVE